MANKPAQEMITDLNPKILDAHEPSSPEYKHKKKLINQEIARKKNSVVVQEWIEIIRNPTSTKGDKVCLVKRMNNGNKHRLYLGKTKQIPEQLEAYKTKGLEVKYF